MTEFSQDLIQKALDFWRPRYKKMDIDITEKNAEEILYNTTEIFKILARWDKEYSEKTHRR